MTHLLSARALIVLTSSALGAVGAGTVQAQSIGTLQGTSHQSLFADTGVTGIAGIVTAVDGLGFWMQDAGDGNDLTSDGIYVFRGGSGTKPLVGDDVRVAGRVQEFRPGNANNLTLTQINASSGFSGSWTAVASGSALPVAKVIGSGFAPPSAIAPNVGNLETAPGYVLQPSQYSIDFYEALEGMRVSVPSAVAVSPTSSFREISLLASASLGMPGTVTAPRGGVVVAPGQFNGQRLMVDDKLVPTPSVHSGAQLRDVVGVMDYNFANYKLNLTQSATVVSNTLTREVATIAPGRFGIATYNVENLGGDATDARMRAIAGQIKNTLGAPHIVALEEVQDNNGSTNDGTVSSALTLGRLTAELNAQTGRNYQYVTVDPTNNTDGGAPGGNIRQAVLCDTGRVSFDGVVGGALQSIVATASPTGHIALSVDAGRIDPTNAAFADSRKPLVTEFRADGQQLIVVANHFNSKSGDQPLYGVNQEPAQLSAVQRLAQAQAVGSFVQGLLAIDPGANIVVVGDFNDFQFAGSLQPLHDAGLINLTGLLPPGERYTYNFEGNLQALDHMFVSPNLVANGALAYDVVHANAEFFDQLSDHDPLLLTMNLAPVPEPETLAMLLSGLVLIGLRVGRRRAPAGH